METHDFAFNVGQIVRDTVNGWTGKIGARVDNGNGNRYRIHFDENMEFSEEADLVLVDAP